MMNQPRMDAVVINYIAITNKKIFIFLIVFIFFSSYSLLAFSSAKSSSLAEKNTWQNKLFPKPQAIEKDVNFWKQVYTQVTTAEGYIHDNVDLSIIYQTVKLPANLSYKARSRHTKKLKMKYKVILDKLAKVIKKNPTSYEKGAALNAEEKRVLALWPDNVTYKTLLRAKKQIRFQLGQANKFKAGLIRSGRWKPYIISVLKGMDLPLEIAALPHVESSFNYKAYSKVGAAGMWQFTRSTGRRYMRVDHVIDERLDPFIATLAAARLLKNNYAVTGTWPLAMTAYNHGAAGMRRASKKVGTTEIVTILRNYKSRSFGFASRNFYPSFLAAIEISNQPELYFKNIKLAPPANFEFVKLTDYVSIDTIIDTMKTDRADLMASNPALRPAIWNDNKYVPNSYELRIDRSLTPNAAQVISDINHINADKRFDKQKADRYHRVTKGQTLSIIAARYGIKMSDLITSNNMRNKHVIRIGQVLILPQKGSQKAQLASKSKIQVKEKNPPKIEPVAVSNDGIYRVKKGDSLDKIARKNSISVRQLLKLNHLRNKNKIYPGQKLVLIKPDEISKQNQVQLAQLDLKLLKSPQNIPETFDSDEMQPSDMTNTGKVIVRTEINEMTPQPLVVKETVSEINLGEKMTPSETAEGEVLIAGSAISNSLESEVLENDLNGAASVEQSPVLLADPSDYTVSEKNHIEIQAAETLGHYAEWLQIRARDLRRLNKMKYGQHVVVGKRLKLSFKKVTSLEFEAQRMLYHKTLQEEFFEQNQIVGVDKYRLNRGESVWKLTKKTYKIPFWLLRQYNPDLNLNRISADIIIRFPKVKQRSV